MLNELELCTIGAMHDTTPTWAQIPKLAMLSPEEIGAMGAFYHETRPCFHWSYHSPYLQVHHNCFYACCWRRRVLREVSVEPDRKQKKTRAALLVVARTTWRFLFILIRKPSRRSVHLGTIVRPTLS